MPLGFRSAIFIFSAAGFMATRTSTLSPGVYTSFDEKWTWNPLTPGSVPAGARISAGKSGKVARSFPKRAAVLVNWLPVICIPSPESPQKRMTAFSTVSRRRSRGSVIVEAIRVQDLKLNWHSAAAALKDARIVSQDAAGSVVNRNGRPKLRVSMLGGRYAGTNAARSDAQRNDVKFTGRVGGNSAKTADKARASSFVG